MTVNKEPTAKANIKPAQPSRIWLIPLLAVLIGGWMVYQDWKNQWPLITIEFATA